MTLFVFALLYSRVYAQKPMVANQVGVNYVIVSKILKQNRKIQVYLPKSYSKTSKRYPVLYVLDGQRYFLNAIAYQQSLVHFSRIPEFIVVGIASKEKNRERLRWFREQPEDFMDFLEKELTVWVDQKFRTNNDRMAFGWQAAGAFLIDALTARPGLLDACFVASMTFRYAKKLPAVLLKKHLETNPTAKNYLYFALSPSETWASKAHNDLAKLLKDKNPENLQWKYGVYEEEDHWTTPYRTIYNGLRNYYSDYKPLEFKNLKAFEEAGGIEYLRKYYQQRGKRYQISEQVHDDTIFSVLICAIRADDYVSFDFFMHTFEFYLQRIKRGFWYRSYARFYLKHKQTAKALKVLGVGLKRFPGSAEVHNGLGQAYLTQGQHKKAKLHYQKAVDIAAKNKNPQLKSYQEDLKKLK